MANKQISKTKYYSWKLNDLPEGCKQCVKGEKLVMFVTGICPRHCTYCPLSEQKKDMDVIYVNERRLSDEKDIKAIIEEVKACKSKGAGFTGGDPLSRIDRTCSYIKLLKKNFGKGFHIHLYTSMNLLSDKNLKKLDDSGLDELRIHPELYNTRLWEKINLFDAEYSFKLGVEIPVLPNSFEITKRLIDHFIPHIDFINLNELEISDAEAFKIKNVHVRNSTYYGAAGSQETAMKILRYVSKKYPKMNVHYCTCKLKDKVQLGERLKRRADNTARKFDIITEDGTLLRGAVYLKETKPEFNYRKVLSETKNKEEIILKLNSIRESLIKRYSIPKNLIEVDSLKLRLITNIGIVKELSKDLKLQSLVPAIVEQYPAYDQMEVEVEFL
jgi:pyruvate formate-lyase activating enzyme-like uncharacterized protein